MLTDFDCRRLDVRRGAGEKPVSVRRLWFEARISFAIPVFRAVITRGRRDS
jgi:hypothetical protein